MFFPRLGGLPVAIARYHPFDMNHTFGCFCSAANLRAQTVACPAAPSSAQGKWGPDRGEGSEDSHTTHNSGGQKCAHRDVAPTGALKQDRSSP